MRESVCAQCQATVDGCWRWCPECGSLRLLDPSGRYDTRWGDDFSVEWEMEDDPLDLRGDRSAVTYSA